MTEEATTGDWYVAAGRRARASARRGPGRPPEMPGFAPPVPLSDGPLGAVQAADREIARQTALRARAVAQFAAARPATADRGQGEPGAMSQERWAARPDVLRGTSEWAAQELVIALSISAEAAQALLTRSLTLVHRLPGTLAALEAGALHPGHLWPLLEKVAPIEDASVRAEVEAELLGWAAGRVTTPAQLGDKARRVVARRDAHAAARKLERAIKQRGIHVRPESTDGMEALTAVLTVPEARALYRALGAYADAIDDADDAAPRTRGQKMADCLLDLVLRPGQSDLPPVQVILTVVASVGTMAGGDDPAEVDGQVVPAEMVRELLRALTSQSALPEPRQSTRVRPSEPGAEPAPQVSARDADSRAWQEIEQEELASWWAEMERRVLAGELDDGADPLSDVEEACAAPADGRRSPTSPDGSPWSSSGPPDDRPPDDGGWWASADRAVEDAGSALRSAEAALAHAGRLVRSARAADAAEEAAWQSDPGGRVSAADDAVEALRAAAEDQRAWLAELLALTGGGGLVERPRIALTDRLTGTLIALTALPDLRRAGTCGATPCRRDPGRCDHDLAGRPGLGRPGATDGYRPSAQLDRWVRTRDRRCRFPGCRRRVPRGGELDHSRPYPLGPTDAANLVGFCTTDHRGKHQAPGWQHTLAPDGTLTVTTPTGLTAVTTPAPY